jgi:hypothetical protein
MSLNSENQPTIVIIEGQGEDEPPDRASSRLSWMMQRGSGRHLEVTLVVWIQFAGVSAVPGAGLGGGVNLAFSLTIEVQERVSARGPPAFAK